MDCHNALRIVHERGAHTMSARDILANEIAELQKQVEGEQRELTARQARLSALEQTISSLRAVLRKIDGDAPDQQERKKRLVAAGRLRPADAVRELLREHPGGLAQKDIVSELNGKLASTSTDQRRVIYNTIFNLRKRGTIEEIAGIVRLKQQA
jgi:hypothetical protein